MALVAGPRYPAVRVFNIVLTAFGLTALARPMVHIRQHGNGGLGGHGALGVALNALSIALVAV